MLIRDLPIENTDLDITFTLTSNESQRTAEYDIDDLSEFGDFEAITFRIDEFEDEGFVDVTISEEDFDKLEEE